MPSTDDRWLLEQCPWLDFVVRFEGEMTTFELLKELKKNNFEGGDFSKIEGISYLDQGKFVRNKLRDLKIEKGFTLENALDVFPSPYLEGIFEGRETATLTSYPGVAILMTSRGCVGNCIYCCFALMGSKTIRYHSVKRVIEELKVIARATPDQEKTRIEINDDAFSLNKSRAKEICRRIVEEGLEKKLSFFCETRADCIDEELLDLMKAAGFDVIAFGLESSNPKILRTIKKVFHPADDKTLKYEKEFIKKVEHYALYAKKIGLKPMLSIMYGLPGQTFEDVMKDIAFINRLGVYEYSQNKLIPVNQTEVYLKRKELGVEIRHTEDPRFPHLEVVYGPDFDKVPFQQNETKKHYAAKFYRRRFRRFRHLLCFGRSDKKASLFFHLSKNTPVTEELKQWIDETGLMSSFIFFEASRIVCSGFSVTTGDIIASFTLIPVVILCFSC